MQFDGTDGLIYGSAVLLAVILLVTGIVVTRREHSRQSIYEFTASRRSTLDFSVRIYGIIEKLPLIGHLARGFAGRYNLMFPGNPRRGYDEAVTVLMRFGCVWLITCAAAGFAGPYMADIKVTPFIVMSACLCSYVICRRVGIGERLKNEHTFLTLFDSFIDSLEFRFYQSHSARNAISEIGMEADMKMRGHTTILYDVMGASDPQEAAAKYQGEGYPEYLGLLLSMAVTNDEQGCGTDDEEGSPFLSGLQLMQEDVQSDIRQADIRDYRYRGRMLIAGLVILLVPYITKWGTTNAPTTLFFYKGETGAFVGELLLVVSYLASEWAAYLYAFSASGRRVYALAAWLSVRGVFGLFVDAVMRVASKTAKELDGKLREIGELYSVRTFYAHRCVCFILAGACTSVVLLGGIKEEREILVSDTTQLYEEGSLIDARQLAVLAAATPEMIQRYAEKEGVVYEAEIAGELRGLSGVRTEECIAFGTSFIYGRVLEHRNLQFGIGEAAACIVCALAGFFYPAFRVRLKYRVSKLRKQEEVRQLQSVICILKDTPGISSVDLLTTMERFSKLFRRPIRNCINSLRANPDKAYETLIEEADCPEMTRLVECFMHVDEIGIKRAFYGLVPQMRRNREDRAAKQEEQVHRQARIATAVACVPGILIIIYMAAPFAIAVYNKFGEIMELLGSIGV